jgi:hypothetical protein
MEFLVECPGQSAGTDHSAPIAAMSCFLVEIQRWLDPPVPAHL